jgi:hypothetical protein
MRRIGNVPTAMSSFSQEEGLIMKRMLIVLTALVMVMSFAVVDAEAGLFGRRKAKKCCCEPTCCEPAPCCEAAPAPCCEPAPAPCGCEAAAAPCGCEIQQCGCQMTRREARKARRNGCCVQTCGCETAPSCGCEAAAPCGCGGEIAAPALEEGAAPEAAPEAPSADPST